MTSPTNHYGDEYEPTRIFREPELTILIDVGCREASVSTRCYVNVNPHPHRVLDTLAYHVAREREDRQAHTGEEKQKRSAEKIATHAKALQEEIENAPVEISRRLMNELYFRFADKGTTPQIHTDRGLLRDLDLFLWTLGQVGDSASERANLKQQRGRKSGDKILVNDSRVEPFSFTVVDLLAQADVEVNARRDGAAARVLEVCRHAAGLNPARGATLVRRYLRPAVQAVRR